MINFFNKEKVFNPKTDLVLIPNKPGIYMVCLKKSISLPKINIKPIYNQFDNLDIIYIGISKKSLRDRDYKTHFNGNNAGRSTLRKSLGSLFGYKKIPRDLNNPENGKTKFLEESEIKLSQWMNESLVLFFNDKLNNYDLESLEYDLIDYYRPLLNLSKNYNVDNKNFRKELKKLRK
tara:strand:- start:4638 stop:5168 length:531 start_codon:yes stop_codon:yes gene_type:complete